MSFSRTGLFIAISAALWWKRQKPAPKPVVDTDKQARIAEYLLGTCNTDSAAAMAFDCDVEEVLEAVVAQDIELCEECGWWSEMSELQDVDGALICNECNEGED